MNNPAVTVFPATPGEPEHYFVVPEKLLAGNPRQSLWMHYTDPSGKFFAGVWHSEVGKWRVTYTEEEYCQILQGVSILTDTAGHAQRLQVGDSFVVPRGFVGTWEVLEPTRKIFAVYESGQPLSG